MVGVVAAGLAYWLLAVHVLWRVRPGLRPFSYTLGAVLATATGLGLAWLCLRCGRAMAGRSLRQIFLGALEEERRARQRWDPAGDPLHSRPLLTALVAALAAYGLVLVLHPPTLEIDDVYWWMYVAGFGVGTTPDEHLWCHHHVFARGLAALYQAWPGGPWYGLHLEVTALLSHLAICYALVRRLGTRGLTMFGLQFFALDSYFAHHLQFTIEAGLAAVGGLLLISLAMAREEPRPWRHLAAGSALLALSSVVRVDACFLVLGVFGPALLVEAWPLDRTRAIRLALVGLVATGLLAAAIENRLYYRDDPDWRDFHYRYLWLCQELVESAERRPTIDYTGETKPIFDEVGWCQADFLLMRHAVYYDEARISEEKVERILTRLPRPWRLHPLDYASQWFQVATHPRVVPALPFVLLVLLGLTRRGWVVLAAGFVVWCGALVYFLNFAKPPPDRVYLSVVAGALWLCGFHAGPDLLPRCWSQFGRWPVTTLRQLLVVTTLAIGAAHLVGAALDGQRVNERASALREAMVRLAPRPDQLYVILGCQYPYHDILPFQDVAFLRPLRALGTYHHSGFNRVRMREYGITDVYCALYERDDVLLISNDEINALLASAIARHHGVEVVFERVFEGPGFIVYDVARRSGR